MMQKQMNITVSHWCRDYGCLILNYAATKCSYECSCISTAIVSISVHISFSVFNQHENPVNKHSMTVVVHLNFLREKNGLSSTLIPSTQKSSKPSFRMVLIFGSIIALLFFQFLFMRPVAKPKPGAVINGTQYKKKEMVKKLQIIIPLHMLPILQSSLQLYKVWSKGLSTPHQIHLCK